MWKPMQSPGEPAKSSKTEALADKALQNKNVLAVGGQGESMHHCVFPDQKQQFNNCYLVLNARPNSFH